MDNMEPVCMPYKLLSEITDGFSDERIVGRGTFGVVYKGEDKDAQAIAVKILKFLPGVNDDDFHREFHNLAKLRHGNIVQLLGFCNETVPVVVEHNGEQVRAVEVHRALCFEYMQNGSLHKHLHDVSDGFDWNSRYRIIKGICEGLKYLHMGSRPVYHLDLKPDNILLDDNMVPKIADFGLSRLLGEETTKATITAVGTCGYLPPEYVNYQIISNKFDIFSLGVVVIKIMMGSAGYSLISDMKPGTFIEHVRNKWKKRLRVTGRQQCKLLIPQVMKCIEIALKCIEPDKNRRPTIGSITDQLYETERHINDSASWMEESSSPTRELRKKMVVLDNSHVESVDLSHIWSMTVVCRAVTDNGDNLGSGGARQGGAVGHRFGSFLKFSKYKMIRVLDLEECNEVNNSHVENICKLWNLRYLSLGHNVNKVPKEISQLKLLEVLQLSKAVQTELPMDIIHMPSLIYLSGKLMLPESEVSTQPELVEESKKSQLQTLSGIVASRRQGFLQLTPKMKKLRRLKICFGQSSEPTFDLINTIKGYLEHELERSLGIDFSNLYETAHSYYPKLFMEYLDRRLSSGGDYYLTSLKLHLRDELVSSMPQFIRENLGCLKKLCLSLTSVTQDLLSDITENLHMLAHLKLKVDRIHMDLMIQEGKFQRLENLCFIVEEFCQNEDGSIPQIHVQGILPELRSFQFLCKNLADLCGIDINKLENLLEIELHGDVSVAAWQQWEAAARNHRKRPHVLPCLSVDDPGSAAIPAAGAGQVVHGIPAADAAVIVTPEGSQLEGYGLADNQAASTSTAVDEPDHEVSVTATVCNDHGLMLNEVVNISAPANCDSPHTAKSVVSATHEDTVASSENGAPNKLIPNNIRSESSIDINNKGTPDATILVQPVRDEVPNHTAEHNASSSGHAVHAR